MGEKQQWSHEHLKCLLETCIEEVNKVGRKGLSMHKDSWSKLGSGLKEKFGMELSQKQMKNAIVPANKQDLYRGRGKRDCYQNVLAICDFNMIFTFVVAGWEGVSHDSRILSEALTDPHVPFPFPPPEKYYLCDAAYAHIRGFMAPYRNVRYWLRNVIERAFGVLKARFPILKRMAPFPLVIQRNVTIACFALHNFIRNEGMRDEFFNEYDEPDVTLQNNNVGADDDEDGVEAHGTAARP